MKKFLFSVLILLGSFMSFAQSEVQIQSNDKGLYVNHTVSAKENFYSIGRLYAISPRDIAAFNGLEMTNGLNIGQPLKIPLNITNFSQSTQVGTPVYYVVGQKEGLYRVSVKNNNVLMANLRKWNNLKSDAIAPGKKLVVGYLVATNIPASAQTTTAPVAKTEIREPVQQPQTTAAQKKPEETRSVEPTTVATTTAGKTPVALGGAGYFKGQFDQQTKKSETHRDQTATAGIFKTASGWQDGKYYALIDNIEPGTIIRVVNPSNNKAIYAKVLGEMSGIRQNQGLEVRISNAAASALEIAEQDKFIIRVNF